MNDTQSQAPLLARASSEAPVAFYRGAARSAAEFARDVRLVGEMLPAGAPLLNACVDRYHFAVGLAAAACAGPMTLLPSAYAAEGVARLKAQYPALYCLQDAALDIGLPTLAFPVLPESTPTSCPAVPLPLIPLGRLVVTVFTSGTTGVPVGHRKSWGSLRAGAAAAVSRLGLDDGRAWSLVATVPPQHMYGLESTVMLGLQGPAVIHAGRPFYPQDIVRALAEVPRPRLLVTSPVHLRALLTSGLAAPPLDAILCATAPLPQTLAVEAETRLGAPLHEIYGATEAGQIASRRPTVDEAWVLFPGLALQPDGAAFRVHGGHVETPALLNDIIEPQGPHTFLLQGRGADVVNVAGKRSSIAYLEQQLLSIPGVIDGAFYMPDEDLAGPVARLTAFVVAPGLTLADIEQALRCRIDPVFLPRPLTLVDSLPRLPTGKLPLEAVKRLLAATRAGAVGGGHG